MGSSWQAGRCGLPCKMPGKLVKGKSLLIFSRKDEQTEKRSQGNAMGPEALRLLSSQGFHLGRVLIHRAVMQPPGLLALMHLNFRRCALLDPARGGAVPEHSTSSAQTLQGERETQERVI